MILLPLVRIPWYLKQTNNFWLTGSRGLIHNYTNPCWPVIWPSSRHWFPASSHYLASCTPPGRQGPVAAGRDAGGTAPNTPVAGRFLQLNFLCSKNCSKLHWLSMGSHWQTPGGNRPQMTAQRPRCVLELLCPSSFWWDVLVHRVPNNYPRLMSRKILAFKKGSQGKWSLKGLYQPGGKELLQREAGKRGFFSASISATLRGLSPGWEAVLLW